MKTEKEINAWLDREWQDAMARTGFFRMANQKDNTMPFSNEQTIARAKVLFIERMEKELALNTQQESMSEK